MTPWLYFSRPANIRYHDLCTSVQIPMNIKVLLGLGLNFCLKPSTTTDTLDLQRFRNDCYYKFILAGVNNQIPSLYIRSNRPADRSEISTEFAVRLTAFEHCIEKVFTKRRSSTNLFKTQHAALKFLFNNPDIIVIKTDKNLGPAVLERSVYIKRAFDDHLSDSSTYRQLDKTTANGRIKSIERIILNFITTYIKDKNDKIYLLRSLKVEDPFSYFYMLAKVHKTPWKTRPIVSASFSLCYGLAKWVDRELQKVVRLLQFTLRSSFDLVAQLKTIQGLNVHTKLFSMDSVSMYTNIDTKHAIDVITYFFKTTDFPARACIDHVAVIEGLKIIMYHNIFKFDDKYWIQLCGTAMGTPPAPSYATL